MTRGQIAAKMDRKVAMKEGSPIAKQVSIAEARDNFPALVRSVEQGQPVELTRRGKPVAVLISNQEYRKLSSGSRDLWDAIRTFRDRHDLSDLEVEEVYQDIRDSSPGREVDW